MADTIFALATARGKAGVAVLRISGPEAFASARALAGDLPPMRRAAVRRLIWNGDVLDEALVLCFGEGSSFTGEDVVELQVHGSQAIISAVMGALAEQPGLRLALPGEFTRRAMDAGRLDLTQVEALADLVDAETEAQRRQAQRVLSGAAAAEVEGWRARMIRAAALIEATIDFADEEVPVDVSPEVLGLISALLRDFRAELARMSAAERVRDGFEVAIIGAPNAGKSTLLNALAGRDAALTSDIAGTTRDVIEVRMDIAGLAVTLLDTAGLRETDDVLERAGIERAVARARAADLRVFLVEFGDVPAGSVELLADDLVVVGKADLHPVVDVLSVSGRTGQGVDRLLSEIGMRLGHRAGPAGSFTRQRHREAFTRAIDALETAMHEVRDGQPEFSAESLRQAIVAMDALVGRIGVEDLLGEIFASFCIGK